MGLGYVEEQDGLYLAYGFNVLYPRGDYPEQNKVEVAFLLYECVKFVVQVATDQSWATREGAVEWEQVCYQCIKSWMGSSRVGVYGIPVKSGGRAQVATGNSVTKSIIYLS